MVLDKLKEKLSRNKHGRPVKLKYTPAIPILPDDDYFADIGGHPGRHCCIHHGNYQGSSGNTNSADANTNGAHGAGYVGTDSWCSHSHGNTVTCSGGYTSYTGGDSGGGGYSGGWGDTGGYSGGGDTGGGGGDSGGGGGDSGGGGC